MAESLRDFLINDCARPANPEALPDTERKLSTVRHVLRCHALTGNIRHLLLTP